MNTTSDTTLASDAAVLTALRALAAGPPGSIADALDAADRQATHLQGLLATTASLTATSLTRLIPSIMIEHIDDIPVPGISFWATSHWHIHLRASDPAGTQNFTMLHELKHIIDHPLRQRATGLSSVDWEALANHFAARVLAREPSPVTMSGERRSADE
jgi:Zn-dependent peptidase ImmA (M78 family)